MGSSSAEGPPRSAASLGGIRYFDRSKPFYPFVIYYQTQLLGLRELALRGILGPRALDVAPLRLFTDRPGVATPATTTEYVRKIAGPLPLKLECRGILTAIDPDEIAAEMIDNRNALASYTMRTVGVLLLLAYEATKGRRNRGAMWEFLYHCRNAIGHDGRFRFYDPEPKWPAEWRHFKLTRSLEGTPLFRNPPEPGLLGPGDPLELLADIEEQDL